MINKDQNVDNFVNKQIFDKQIIYSIEALSIFKIINLIDKCILYHDWVNNEYYFIKSKSDLDYHEIKIYAMRSNIQFNENNNILWFYFKGITSMNQKLDDFVQKNMIYLLNNVYHFSSVILKNNRFFYLGQFKSEDSSQITKLFVKLQNVFDEVLGPGSMEIHDLSNNLYVPVEFIKFLNIKTSIYEIRIKINYQGEEIKGLMKYISLKNNENNHFYVFYKNKLNILTLSDIQNIGKELYIFLKNLIDLLNINISFLLYFDFTCNINNCKFTIMFEEKMVNTITEALEKIIENGVNVQIDKYIKIL